MAPGVHLVISCKVLRPGWMACMKMSQQRVSRWWLFQTPGIRRITLFGVVWLILGITYGAQADVRVSFTKMTINNCDEIGVCDWRLACALGNQTKIEFFQFVEGNTNEEITIDQALTQKEFPPVTVNCEVQEHDGGIGTEWEDVPSSPLLVRTTGPHIINASGSEGDVDIHFNVETTGSIGQPLTDAQSAAILVPILDFVLNSFSR
jgi:hypothetical protein